jgi:hypothetical protein
MRSLTTLTALAVLLSAGVALAQGPPPLTPLVVDGERYFKLQWEAGEHAGRPTVHGTVFNDYGFAARQVRLLIDSLDSTGAVTAQTIAYVPHDLTPGSRYHFEARVPERASSYRVVMFQWEWIQAGGGDPR